MSVPVALDALRAEVDRRGRLAHLVTRGDDRAHVVSVAVTLRDGDLVIGCGGTSKANATARPGVTLLWAGGPGEAYDLLVDGPAVVVDDDLVVVPAHAVLHRRADAGDEAGPGCVHLA